MPRGRDNQPKNRFKDANGVTHAVRRYRQNESSKVRVCDLAWVSNPLTEAEASDIDCMSCISATTSRAR